MHQEMLGVSGGEGWVREVGDGGGRFPQSTGLCLWHKDVQVFQIQKDGQLQSFFYFDPYSRPENKKGGAWMSDVADRWASTPERARP